METGVQPDRFSLDWASAAEGPLYVELITKFTQKIKEFGPLGKAEGIPIQELKMRLGAAKAAASGIKLRTRYAKLTQELREINDYTDHFIESKMSEKMDDAISRELERHL